ncbi:hypothetical protein BLNAU_10750 [Blattamonas nauphoetae]|uniref:Uncharacterized protein n=1 Tax=Blattamonas nauphoetae TaxID=2049346 RepID=A0ABQ9XSX1_9EUKA|nr:hypothetical protein BLNAU_10750 [Blattamonas nauphoetae]
MKFNYSLDDALEAKAVRFLKSVALVTTETADAFLSKFASFTDESLTDFVQSIVVLLSSPNCAIITATMEIISTLFWSCSPQPVLTLFKANLFPQLIITLNPQSLSFDEAVDIHTNLMNIIARTLHLTSPSGLAKLGIEDRDEQQAVHETVLNQVLVPSEKYIGRLCVNRYSILDGEQSMNFFVLLAQLLEISPSSQHMMDFVLHLPVFLTIPSCLTFFEIDDPICTFLSFLDNAQWRWNQKDGEARQMWKKVSRMLRMEGMDDVTEQKLLNEENTATGKEIVEISIYLSNKQGLNLLKPE